jgi:hypothetical protein
MTDACLLGDPLPAPARLLETTMTLGVGIVHVGHALEHLQEVVVVEGRHLGRLA